MSRTLKVTGNYVMYDRRAWFRFGFCDIQNNQGLGKDYQPQPTASADNPLPRPWLQKSHPIIVYYYTSDSLRKIWLVERIQFTIACELDMINAISAAGIAFIMSSSTSAWLLSPFECSPQKQNGWTLPFCFWGWIMWKMYNKTIIEFGFSMISWIIKTSCLCYLSQSSASADNTDLGFDK